MADLWGSWRAENGQKRTIGFVRYPPGTVSNLGLSTGRLNELVFGDKLSIEAIEGAIILRPARHRVLR